MPGGITSAPENAASRSRRIDGAPDRKIAESAAVIPAVPVRTRRKRSLAVPVVDNNTVLVDALLFSATFKGRSRGHKQNKMYRARSFHKIYCGLAEINLRSRAAVVSCTSPVVLSKPKPPASPMAASIGVRPFLSFTFSLAP
jgi:hypothetical protein